VRVLSALIGLRHMVHEISTEFLGPLPLNRHPKSKPFTPLFSYDSMVRHASDISCARTITLHLGMTLRRAGCFFAHH